MMYTKNVVQEIVNTYTIDIDKVAKEVYDVLKQDLDEIIPDNIEKNDEYLDELYFTEETDNFIEEVKPLVIRRLVWLLARNRDFGQADVNVEIKEWKCR